MRLILFTLSLFSMAFITFRLLFMFMPLPTDGDPVQLLTFTTIIAFMYFLYWFTIKYFFIPRSEEKVKYVGMAIGVHFLAFMLCCL
ncbi:hypothetical protein [Psychrobacillus sp.]|uniref:hypothetical protein n=1 Tax=Psychrobacillus sp. TaxID=1871623 RepID=UPI0028BE9835|nr:hypothetical protein [Psychrobacillus sp.]